jgi:hypothetical protein
MSLTLDAVRAYFAAQWRPDITALGPMLRHGVYPVKIANAPIELESLVRREHPGLDPAYNNIIVPGVKGGYIVCYRPEEAATAVVDVELGSA